MKRVSFQDGQDDLRICGGIGEADDIDPTYSIIVVFGPVDRPVSHARPHQSAVQQCRRPELSGPQVR
jgi:hypothetical protein